MTIKDNEVYIARRKTQRNPRGWRWALALWLIGRDPIEAIPLDLQRGVSAADTVVIRLGAEGAYNTVQRREPER